MSVFSADESRLTERERCLLARLEREYSVDVADAILLPFAQNTSPISLRLLDWAVVNWSKKRVVVCASTFEGHATNVHMAYRRTLAYWRRRLFDPFRRRARVRVRDGQGCTYETTLGQANFVLFAHRSGILAYVLRNATEIERDMNACSKQHKDARKRARRDGVYRKRAHLSVKATTRCAVHARAIRVEWE